MTKFEFGKEWIDAYFEYGVDFINRRVFLDQDIDIESVGAAIKGLYLMETASNTDPVEIFISSYGGCVYESLALYDIMNTLKCPVYTFGFGKIMSAAVLLLAAGAPGHRWVTPNVALMHHDWSCEIEGKGEDLRVAVKEGERLNQNWTKLLADCTNKDFRWWHNRSKKNADFYFSAEQALDWGVADSMWVEK